MKGTRHPPLVISIDLRVRMRKIETRWIIKIAMLSTSKGIMGQMMNQSIWKTRSMAVKKNSGRLKMMTTLEEQLRGH